MDRLWICSNMAALKILRNDHSEAVPNAKNISNQDKMLDLLPHIISRQKL